MNKSSEISIDIAAWPHVATAKREATKRARRAGFNEQGIGEIAIAISELAENLLEHNTDEGRLIISLIEDLGRPGIQIISEDKGPGIADVRTAMRDGFSNGGTLGIGLGAVKRMMDEFDITSKTERGRHDIYEQAKAGIGTVIVARKWVPKKEVIAPALVKGTRFGIFSRAKLDQQHNGDNYFLQYFDDKAFMAVIDGIGHGPEAEKASQEAYNCFIDNYKKPLTSIINELHTRLKRTRGAAISMALIDDQAEKMQYAGIGNVTTRVFRSEEPVHPVNYNGIVGSNIRTFKVFTYPWKIGNVIIMSSDGISEKYDLDQYPGLINKHPVVIADVIFRDFSRGHDDATIIVGGPAR